MTITLGQALRYHSLIRSSLRLKEPIDPVPHVPAPIRLRLKPVTLQPLALWPVVGTVTSQFGERVRLRAMRPHAGVDIAARVGTPVVAPSVGRVQSVGYQRGYGLVIILDHGAGRQTVYAHLSATSVAVGDQVSAGDVIAATGRSGHVTGPHLHYEVRQNGVPVNPRS